jgi:hypothetical protein
MKTLFTLFYKLTLKDYDASIKSALKTTNMIISSTNGSISHFYNAQGMKVRGWEGRQYKFQDKHPLIEKYK